MTNREARKVHKQEDVKAVSLLTFSSDKHYDQVLEDLLSQLGVLDEEKVHASSDPIAAMESMVGKSGLMLIRTLEMADIVKSLKDNQVKARQYLIGNPLIATKMAKHNPLAAFYVPPRVLVFAQNGKTSIAYDQPSTTLGKLGSEEITTVANDLDTKFENLVRNALA